MSVQQQQQQQPSRLVLQLCFAILLLLLESMSPPKPSESPEANFYHILISKNPRKKLQEAQNHNRGNAQKTQGEEAAQRSDAAMQRARDRKRKRASATWHSLHERDDDLTRPDPTKPRVVSYVAAENESNHKRFFFCSFQAPHLFPCGYFKRI
jgi:hypothetical protein